MAEERKYPDPLFKIAGKDKFLELYDGLDMKQPKMHLRLTTYKRGEKGSAKRVDFFFDPQTFFGFCDVILNGAIDEFVPTLTGDKATDNAKSQEDRYKGFPANHYGIPRSGEKMRRWSMFKTQMGNYGISILERERRDKWDSNAPELGHITFNVPPFQLYAMASTGKSYLERALLRKELAGINTPAQEDEETPPIDDSDFGIE